MKLNLGVCDDNAVQLNIIHLLIEEFALENFIDLTVDLYQSSSKLVNEVIKHPGKYQVILLDMEMPELNGIETAKCIRKVNKNLILIFITGHDRYALKAFDVKAFDYILKPINKEKIKGTLLDALERIYETKVQIDPGYIVIAINKRNVRIYFYEIIYLEKMKNIVLIHCKNETYRYYSTINKIMEVLDPNLFIQTHQGYIVNKKKITSFSDMNLTLADEYKVPVSKQNVNKIRSIFFNLLREEE